MIKHTARLFCRSVQSDVCMDDPPSLEPSALASMDAEFCHGVVVQKLGFQFPLWKVGNPYSPGYLPFSFSDQLPSGLLLRESHMSASRLAQNCVFRLSLEHPCIINLTSLPTRCHRDP